MEGLFSVFWGWIVLCAVVAALYAGALYYKNRKDDFSLSWCWLLAALRAVMVFAVLFLFFSPNVRVKHKQIEKPLAVVAVDVSGSMDWKNKEKAWGLWQKSLSDFSSQMKDRFEIRVVLFGSHSREMGSKAMETAPLGDVCTHFSDLFSYLRNEFEQRTGVVLLLSDGRYNRGLDPLYDYKKVGVPLYTICVGDTAVYPDWFIEREDHNRYAYKGQEFPLRVFLNSAGAIQEDTEVWLSVTHKGKRLKRERVDACFPQGSVEVYLPAEEIGIQSYDISLQSGRGEKNLKNNRRSFFIEVLEGKKRVLILAHHAHPDVGALRKSLEKNGHYEVEVRLGSEVEKSNQLPFDLCILHGLPSVNIPLRESQTGGSLSYLYVLTPSTSSTLFNALKTGIELPLSPSFGESSALYQSNFGYFQASTAVRMEGLPPLNAVWGIEAPQDRGEILFWQGITRIQSSYPLWWFSRQGGKKVGVIAGEGIWRWRLWDYMQNGSSEAFDQLIGSSAQLLSVRDENDLLKINTETFYTTDESVVLTASLYDRSGRPISEAEIRLEIQDSLKKKKSSAFEPISGGYRLDLGHLASGTYQYTASAPVGDQTYRYRGGFKVEDEPLEQMDIPANKAQMKQWASRYRGQSYWTEMEEVNKVMERVGAHWRNREDMRPRFKEEEKDIPLGHNAWVLAALLVLMGTEYLLRKKQTEI